MDMINIHCLNVITAQILLNKLMSIHFLVHFTFKQVYHMVSVLVIVMAYVKQVTE